MAKIYFIDVTNRDGVQTSRISLAKLQKTMLNVYLGRFGVHQSEAGFPFLRHEQNYLMANLELQRLGAMGTMRLSGWCRAIVDDVAPALPLGFEVLNVSASTSDQMIIHKYQGRRDRARVIEDMVESVALARNWGVRCIGVNAEDASRTDMEYLVEFSLAAKEAGAHRLRYCDTVGCHTPLGIYRRVRELAERVGLPIELHCHNDAGMAVANSVAGAIAAVDAGVDAYINGTVNGIGDRAGNADLLSCILAFKFTPDAQGYEIGDPINLRLAAQLARYAAYAFGLPIPVNQPGVGANAFAHEAGIHADATLKDHRNYELFGPEEVGMDEAEPQPAGRIITIGEYGGLSGLRYVCESLGISLPNDQWLAIIFELAQYANAHTQRPLTGDELRLIAEYPEQVARILTTVLVSVP